MKGMKLKVESALGGIEQANTTDYWCVDESGNRHLLNLFTNTDHQFLASDVVLVGKTVECEGFNDGYAKNVKLL